MWVLVWMLIGVCTNTQAQSIATIDSLENILERQRIGLNAKLSIFNELAGLYNLHKPSEKGVEYARNAVKIAKKLKNAAAEGLAYNHLGDLLNKVNRQSWDTSLVYYQKALEIRRLLAKKQPQSLDKKLDLALTLSDIAFAYWMWGKLSQALEYYKESLKIADVIYQKDAKYTKIEGFIAMRRNNMGAIYWAQSKYKEAIEDYLKALRIYEKIDYPGRINQVMTNIGMVYFEWQQYDKAIEYYRKAIKIAQKIEHYEGLGYAQNNLGNLFEEIKQYDSAMVYFEKSAQSYLKVGDGKGAGLNYNSIGSIYQKKEKYTKAIEEYTKASDIAQENQSKYWIATTSKNLASAFLALKQWEKTKANLSLSQKIAIEEGYKDIVKDNYLIYAELYEQIKQPEKALEQYRLFMMMKDSIFSEDKFKQISQIEAQYEFEKNQKDNEILKQKNEIQEKNLLQSQYEKIALTLFIFLLLCFVAYVWFGRQKLKITHQQLQQRNLQNYQQKKILESQAAQLEEVNEVKDRLFSIVAHDLKSPIAQLEAVMALVQDEHISETELKKILPEINKNISYTSDLINNLLHWAKSQMQGLSIDAAPFDIHSLVRNKVNLLEKTAEQKEIHLKNEIPIGTEVFADPDMIDLVLRNLISNALKFCHKGDKITIKAYLQQDFIRIAVEDTGQGISPENLPKIFNHQNFTTRGTANEKGTGLGLSLCKDFIEQNQGEIWVESELDQGSTFYFTLPKAPKKEK